MKIVHTEDNYKKNQLITSIFNIIIVFLLAFIVTALINVGNKHPIMFSTNQIYFPPKIVISFDLVSFKEPYYSEDTFHTHPLTFRSNDALSWKMKSNIIVEIKNVNKMQQLYGKSEGFARRFSYNVKEVVYSKMYQYSSPELIEDFTKKRKIISELESDMKKLYIDGAIVESAMVTSATYQYGDGTWAVIKFNE